MPKTGKEQIMELVKRARKGDDAAFSKIYIDFITPIYRFIYFRVGSREEAEDLTQTVFLRAWSALDRFDEESSISPWLYTIARNIVIDFWKKKKCIPLEDMEEKIFEIPDFESFEKENEFEKIKIAMKDLSDGEQEILSLKFIEDLSNAEISRKIGKSEMAIRQAQCRAIKQLKNILR